MSSRSFRAIVATLSLTEGCAVLCWEHHQFRPRNKTIRAITGRVVSACSAAHKLWPEKLTLSEAEKLGSVMADAERAAFTGEREDIVTYISLSLGLISDTLDRISEPRRKEALEEVHAAMLALHRYFDKRLNQWEQYKRASAAIEVWREKMAA